MASAGHTLNKGDNIILPVVNGKAISVLPYSEPGLLEAAKLPGGAKLKVFKAESVSLDGKGPIYRNVTKDYAPQIAGVEAENAAAAGKEGVGGERTNKLLYANADKGTGKVVTEIKHIPSSGVKLTATPGKTTTILGNYQQDMRYIIDELGNVKTTYSGPNDGGFNVLNIPDAEYKGLTREQFWEKYNKPWLDNAINRGDDIVLATTPEGDFLLYTDKITGRKVITGFGREYNYLLKKGYVYDTATNKMIRK